MDQESRRSSAADGLEPMVTRSEEDLTLIGSGEFDDDRHCVASRDNTLIARHGSDHFLEDSGSHGIQAPDHEKSHSENELESSIRSDLRRRGGMKKSKRQKRSKQKTTSTFTSYLSSSEDDLLDKLDYKTRRARTVHNSSLQQEIALETFRMKLDFLAPSAVKPGMSKVEMKSPDLSSRRRGKSRDRSGSRPMVVAHSSPQLVKKTSWVSRYRPGVPVPAGSARESIVQAELRRKERDFCIHKEIRCAR